jgi:hypothetical protein
VVLGPTWGTTARPLGFAPNPCAGGSFWRPGDGSFKTGWGSVRLRRPNPATDRRPADESTSGPEGQGQDPGGVSAWIGDLFLRQKLIRLG